MTQPPPCASRTGGLGVFVPVCVYYRLFGDYDAPHVFPVLDVRFKLFAGTAFSFAVEMHKVEVPGVVYRLPKTAV